MTQKVEGFTPGPWYWNNSGGQHPTLFAGHSLVVMDFVRMGMYGAQPRFSDRNGELRGGLMHKWGDKDFNAHPDAVLIAQAPTLYAENKRLREVGVEALEDLRLARTGVIPDMGVIDRLAAALGGDR